LLADEIAPIALRLSDMLFASHPVAANDKPRELYFSGRLIELDAAKHTFTIRNGKKDLVFTIVPQRCDITVDGSMTERNLRFAASVTRLWASYRSKKPSRMSRGWSSPVNRS
jgi:hypothetical protein